MAIYKRVGVTTTQWSEQGLCKRSAVQDQRMNPPPQSDILPTHKLRCLPSCNKSAATMAMRSITTRLIDAAYLSAQIWRDPGLAYLASHSAWRPALLFSRYDSSLRSCAAPAELRRGRITRNPWTECTHRLTAGEQRQMCLDTIGRALQDREVTRPKAQPSTSSIYGEIPFWH